MPHPESTDERLVAAVRAGDERAFATIVSRYESQLVGYARQILGGAHHDAEEVVQDAFVRALRALQGDDREMVLRPWLHAIVRNRALDQLRRANHTTELEPHVPVLRALHADPASAIGRREDFDRVVDALGELPERQRRALVMHELEDRTHSQIGRVLGVTKGGSKALVHRARRGLAA